jgi:HPt (histidine-containing phosphotransfer) domain-containing protein
MNDHIGKPFRRDELFGVIARWTNKASFGTIQGGKSEAANTVVDYDVFEGLKEVLGADMLNRLVDQLVVMLDERLVGDCATPEGSKRLAQDAHSIVSAAGTLGFIRLAKACQELEAAILSGELVEPILEKVRAARLQVLSEVPRLRHAA